MESTLTKYSPYTTDTMSLEAIAAIDDTYSYHVRDYLNYCADRGDIEVTEENVHDYFADLNESTYAAGTIRIKRQAVKKRIRQLLEHAPIDTQIRIDRYLHNIDHFGDTRAPKVASTAVRHDKVVSESERMILIAATTYRLGLCIEFLWSTGCRVNEMTGVRIGDCKREGDIVDIRVVGKGNKERHVILTPSLFDKIRDYFRGEEYLFETQTGRRYVNRYISDQIRKLGRRTLGRTIAAHSFRHSFATRKIRQTGNLKGVSEYMGHSSTAITANMYDHNLLSAGDILEPEIIAAVAE